VARIVKSKDGRKKPSDRFVRVKRLKRKLMFIKKFYKASCTVTPNLQVETTKDKGKCVDSAKPSVLKNLGFFLFLFCLSFFCFNNDAIAGSGCSAPSSPGSTSTLNVGCTGFRAQWTASATGTVSRYEVQVATNATFAAIVTGYDNVNAGTSLFYDVTNLNQNTTYYWRVRAYNTGNGGCGSAYSNGPQVTTLNAQSINAGSNQILASCVSSTSMSASSSYQGVGVWSIVSGSGNITNTNSPTSTVTNLPIGQTSVFRWTVTNGDCVSAADVSITTQAGPGCWNYCAASALSTSFEKISNVTFNTINNNSSSTAVYENFTGVSTTVLKGQSYNFSATINGAYSTDQVIVWIDYNNNGSFADAGEQVYTSATGVGPHSTSFSIPLGAVNGSTRMRVRLHDTGATTPNSTSCGSSSFGQVEDYTVNITSLSACSGVINPGTISLSPTVGCSSLSVNLSATNSDLATGLSYQWEKSTTSTFTSVTNVSTAQSTMVSSVTDIPGGTRYYRLKVQCNGGNAYYSNVLTYEAISSSTVYCEPNSTATGFPITNVTFAGINNSNAITNQDYQDFTCTSGAGVLNQGTSYPISVTFALSGSNSNVFALNLFFDWNNDGDFVDAGEEVLCGGYSGFATSNTYNGTINVPVNAANAVTRMRVMHKYDSYSTPCFNGGNNLNVQDYLLKVGTVTTALPVELISFTSECQNEDVEVKWSTASEYNADYYTVQHSEDGMNWSTIGQTEAAGFSNVVVDYSFVHQNAARAKNYYRLLQYDNDGAMKMYNTIMANCSSDETVFMTFPNPSADALTVVVNDQLLSGLNTLNITDASGKVIYSTAVELENGSGSFALEGLDLPAGLYYLQLNNGSHTSRVIKHSFR
jgi:hypothetical protein